MLKAIVNFITVDFCGRGETPAGVRDRGARRRFSAEEAPRNARGKRSALRCNQQT
jgi:hypothetical protein